MPDNYIWTNLNGDICLNLNGLNGTYCFPIKDQCQDTDDEGLLQSCTQPYCVIRCIDDPTGEIPYIRGDKIMFQTQFRDLFNADPENPQAGWGEWVFMHIIDAATGNEYQYGMEDFRKYVCHNGQNSFQVIEIDTGVEVFPCVWYAVFYAYKLDETDPENPQLVEVDCRQTHNFKEADDCMETHTIEGLYARFDCKGNYYGQTCDNFYGDEYFQYSNKTRIEGSIVKKVPTVQTNDGKVEIVDNYKLTSATADKLSGVLIPNYLISWYSNILSAKIVNIDEISYQFINFALSTESNTEKAALVNFEWSSICNSCK
jgi:hypothetical protein